MKLHFKFSQMVILSVVLLCVAVGATIQALTYKELERQTRMKNVALNSQLQQVETKHIRLTNECDLLKQQCTELGKLHEFQESTLHTYIRKNYPRVPNVVAKEIAKQTTLICSELGAPFPVIVALMQVESSFQPSAVSKAGALGLMQVMPKIWIDHFDYLLEARDLHEIDLGIKAGVEIYLQEYDKTGSISEALDKYLGGDSAQYKSKIFNAMGEFTIHMAEERR
jgi:hypothetical protein